MDQVLKSPVHMHHGQRRGFSRAHLGFSVVSWCAHTRAQQTWQCVSFCLVLQIEPIKRKEEAPMESGSTGGVVLGQRRVPFKELRMGTLLGAGG